MACKPMDALSVVSQIRDLASEPQNREAIVKDKCCLPGLVLFLDHCNLQVLHCALQALQYLAECPSNREIMINELGMMSNLERLQERLDLYVVKGGSTSSYYLACDAVSRLAEFILHTKIVKLEEMASDTKEFGLQCITNDGVRILMSTSKSLESFPEGKKIYCKIQLINSTFRDYTSEGIRILATEIYELLKKPVQTTKMRNNSSSTRKVQTRFFINSTSKKAKTITLQIHGLHNMDSRDICEEALLQVKGVISFTFQMAVQRCVIRIYSDLKIESLASAIAATKILQAHQVVKNENGEEVLIPLNTGATKAEQNLNLPDYLPEDESPETEHNKSISQTGAKGNTNGTWLNAAANFLTKTFYW